MKQHLKPTIVLAVTLVLFVLGWVAVQAHARSSRLGYAIQAQRPHDPHSVLVKFAPDALSPLKRTPGARHLFGDWYQIPVSEGKTTVEWMNALAARDDVALVELNYLLHLDDMESWLGGASSRRGNAYPDDPLYSRQWHLPMVQSQEAWDVSRGENVIVAVVDSGVSKGDDLACRTFVAPYNAITDAPNAVAAEDQNGHGTHVAGTIGQCTDNGIGVAGMAPDVKLMPVRVLDANGNGTMAGAAAGINWAVDHGARIINLSLGMRCYDRVWPDCSGSVVNDAIDRATAQDVLIVAAAGNSSDNTLYFPANHPDVLAVAAVDYNQKHAWYSNKSDALDISAPGGDTSQDVNQDGFPDGIYQQTFVSPGVWDYYYKQGTSMAAPHVSGAAALLWSYFPSASRKNIMAALLASAKDLGDPGFDVIYGHGLLQAATALRTLRDTLITPTPTRTPTPTFTPTPANLYLPYLMPAAPTPRPAALGAH